MSWGYSVSSLEPLPDEPAVAVLALGRAHDARDDRLPAGRQLAQLREVEVAVERERERAQQRFRDWWAQEGRSRYVKP